MRSMGLRLEAAQQRRLLDYLALLYKWNRAFNLTAVRDPARAVSRQLLDSLSILPLVEGPRVVDLGSGAGLPGIPLAIARPGWHFALVDANLKKSRFLRQARMELALENVEVVRQRAEHFRPATPFRSITSRAFASLGEMLAVSRHLLEPGGRWVAMKGRLPREELAALPAELTTEVVPLRVPGEPAARHAVVIREKGRPPLS